MKVLGLLMANSVGHACDLVTALTALHEFNEFKLNLNGNYKVNGATHTLRGDPKGRIYDKEGTNPFKLEWFDHLKGVYKDVTNINGRFAFNYEDGVCKIAKQTAMWGWKQMRMETTINWKCGPKFQITSATDNNWPQRSSWTSSCRTDIEATMPCCDVTNPQLWDPSKPAITWSGWGSYSSCSATCGDGVVTRARTCDGGSTCPGVATEQKSCNLERCGTWKPWAQWGACSATCGNGMKTKTRACQGRICSGEPFETISCNLGTCPEWSVWGPIGACSVTCGDGMRKKTRVCDGGSCPGTDTEQTACNLDKCYTPCPSHDCWDYDSSDDQCTLKDGCVKLACGSTKMIMSVMQSVFADDSSTVTGVTIDSDGYYNVECNLGDPCATHSFSTDGSKIEFASKIAAAGDARTRSVDNNVIELGNGVKIATSPFGVSVDYTCIYDSSVEVSSDAITVQDVSISGTHSASGNLQLGFIMTAGDGSAIVLGNDLVVSTTWSLDIAGISPHYERCEVAGATATVLIVKDGCMATTLGAVGIANDSGVTNAVHMQFKSFLIEGEVSTTQLVKCDVKLCSGTANCAKDSSCKKNNDPYGYE